MQIFGAYHLHGGSPMRTTLNVDDEALASAMKVSPGKTKTDVINEALREYARRRRIQEFLELEGKMHWEGDLDQLRGRAS
jgi:Arc/MetJ family transcription regulator